eukprot:gene7709-8222_t
MHGPCGDAPPHTVEGPPPPDREGADGDWHWPAAAAAAALPRSRPERAPRRHGAPAPLYCLRFGGSILCSEWRTHA